MTSLSLPCAADPGSTLVATDAASLSIRVANTLAEVEGLWRAFEADAVASPYGRFDWIAPFAARMLAPQETLRVATIHDAAGRLAMILPLARYRQHGLAVASPLGGKHANFNVPLLRPGFSLTAFESRQLLARIGQQLHVDLVVCRNAPVSWRGTPNPLAAGGRPSPSNAYKLALSPNAEATLTRVSSNAARKKLRNKERALAKLGAVAVIEARTEAEVDLVLDALLAQKKRRFQELGITDPYAGEAARLFLRGACLAGLAEGQPAIELHALTLDGNVVAALGSAADAQQLSGMFISFDAAGDAAKSSPGEILVANIIRQQCERGRKVFDLGVGEARYKRVFCDEVELLHDNVVGVTPLGRLYGAALGTAIDVKRRLKASPKVMRLVASARRARSTTLVE